MRTPARRSLLATSAFGVLGSMAVLVAQSPQPPAHTTLFYTRDGLRLESVGLWEKDVLAFVAGVLRP